MRAERDDAPMHDDETPTVALRRLTNGYQVTQAIHVAAALGIADRLRDGPRDSDALAQETATHAPALPQPTSLPQRPYPKTPECFKLHTRCIPVLRTFQ